MSDKPIVITKDLKALPFPPLGKEGMTIQPGETAFVAVQNLSGHVFLPHRLVIAELIGMLLVKDLIIDGVPQFTPHQEIPAVVFSPMAEGADTTFDPLPPQGWASLIIRNPTEQPQRWGALLMGREQEEKHRDVLMGRDKEP